MSTCDTSFRNTRSWCPTELHPAPPVANCSLRNNMLLQLPIQCKGSPTLSLLVSTLTASAIQVLLWQRQLLSQLEPWQPCMLLQLKHCTALLTGGMPLCCLRACQTLLPALLSQQCRCWPCLASLTAPCRDSVILPNASLLLCHFILCLQSRDCYCQPCLL